MVGDTTADSLFNYYPAGLESDEVDFNKIQISHKALSVLKTNLIQIY